jgi:glycosyltransferase involved in cell wall biosynthesis
VTEWLGITDVFAHPSLMEGMSNAVLEAMAVALPVLATRAGGNPEIVEHGVTGILVPPASPTALSDAMLSYCDNEQARVTHGAAGRERAKQHYPLAKMLAGYTGAYHTALARRAKAVAANEGRAARA